MNDARATTHAQVIPVPSFPGCVWIYGPNGSRILIGALVFTLVTAALSPTVLMQESAQDSTKDPSERAFTNACAKCHPAERVTAMRRTRSQWEEVINKMITVRGAQVFDEDFDAVLGYLTRVYGSVNVNRAPAPDIVEVLNISDSLAAAIVTYRREHGAFEDFDALVKVPGIDRRKLEQKRDAITF